MSRIGAISVHIVLILIGFVWIYPFLCMLSASFKDTEEFFAGSLSLIPAHFNLANFTRAWYAGNFNQYFLNTFIVTATVIIIVLAITATCGYALGRYAFPGRRWLLLVFGLSIFVPLEFSVIPIFQLIKSLGLLDSRLGIILAEAGGGHVLFVLLFASFFRQVPKELEEASIIDGCGFFRTFIRVILPLSKPIIGSVTIMQFIWTWNSFLLPLVLTLSNPALRTLAVGMYALRGENIIDWTGLAAGGTIALAPIILLFLFLQRYFVDGMAGSIKG
ncbi:carbohydrate ABC transporter permease [Paenibacillus rhizophilus]|uniref:Carbohydrate ABC transporter permease n=1 Tax=Paenibacillus rhizophilus TaxID=1850366 RepID=A0A3N9PBZ3_9BACL|nr:carbohydrate ABC transporter permease [Paenibacillus rhizophilus]RQW12767.1 carbohydrate ABC transporter permease [Paenibacillus rhizophilus]